MLLRTIFSIIYFSKYTRELLSTKGGVTDVLGLNIAVPTENISELEAESIINFLLRESISIVSDELDYFFDGKEKLVDFLVEGLDLRKTSPEAIQERFNKVLYNQGDIEKLILRIEGLIRREIQRSIYVQEFHLAHDQIGKVEQSYAFQGLNEGLKTLKFSHAMAKIINMALNKSTKTVLPKAFNKIISRFKISYYILASAKVSPKEIKDTIQFQLAKRLRGTLKQNKNELKNIITKEIVGQLLQLEGIANTKHVLTVVKTAL